MPKEDICLSTVPPDAAPAPCMRMDLPYAVALRDFFGEYKMRAQENTRYMEADGRDATVSHVMNLMISRLTSADIQSTITPDEGRNVPWHYNNIAAVNTAKQSLVGMDGLREMVKLDRDAPGAATRRCARSRSAPCSSSRRCSRTAATSAPSRRRTSSTPAIYPETHDDGIAPQERRRRGGGHDRAARRRLPRAGLPPLRREPPAGGVRRGRRPGRRRGRLGPRKPCDLIGGCTLCDADKVPFIDELDPEDNVNARLAQTAELREKGLIKPEVEWAADGSSSVTLFLPAAPRVAEFAALEFGKAMNLQEREVINKQVMHPAEGTLIEIKGRLDVVVDPARARHPARARGAAATRRSRPSSPRRTSSASPPPSARTSTPSACARSSTSSTAASRSGASRCEYLGTSVPVEKVLDAAIEHAAQVVLISTIITHGDMHRNNMEKLADLAVEKGVRDKLLLISGGTQVTDELARSWGMDAGFGRGTKGIDVASFVVKTMRERGM